MVAALIDVEWIASAANSRSQDNAIAYRPTRQGKWSLNFVCPSLFHSRYVLEYTNSNLFFPYKRLVLFSYNSMV